MYVGFTYMVGHCTQDKTAIPLRCFYSHFRTGAGRLAMALPQLLCPVAKAQHQWGQLDSAKKELTDKTTTKKNKQTGGKQGQYISHQAPPCQVAVSLSPRSQLLRVGSPRATAVLQVWDGTAPLCCWPWVLHRFPFNSFIFHLFNSPQIPCLRVP